MVVTQGSDSGVLMQGLVCKRSSVRVLPSKGVMKKVSTDVMKRCSEGVINKKPKTS